jgi:hypothetical protein
MQINVKERMYCPQRKSIVDTDRYYFARMDATIFMEKNHQQNLDGVDMIFNMMGMPWNARPEDLNYCKSVIAKKTHYFLMMMVENPANADVKEFVIEFDIIVYGGKFL